MKERPILFSAPMVRAILEGRKTQTRRVVKYRVTGPNPPQTLDFYDGDKWKGACHENGRTGNALALCPYGKPGDRLWVRETWREREPNQDCYSLEFRADRPEYKTRDDDPCSVPWRPSIHMPRTCSRINLEVTGVRVERLQDITNRDAIAEGLTHVADGCSPWGIPGLPASWSGDPRVSYWGLWDSINGDGSWLSNPWVWVVEFKRIQA